MPILVLLLVGVVLVVAVAHLPEILLVLDQLPLLKVNLVVMVRMPVVVAVAVLKVVAAVLVVLVERV